MVISDVDPFVPTAEDRTSAGPSSSVLSYPMDNPRILLIGGGRDSLGIVNRCLQMGLSITVADIDPAAPARKRADWFLEVDCYNPGAVVRAAEAGLSNYGMLNAVLSAGTDTPDVMAMVAAHFDIPGQSLVTAEWSKDKYAQAQRLLINGCNIPNTGLTPAAHYPIEINEKMVMKPRDSRGARGVVLMKPGDVISAAQYIYSAQFGSGDVILQEWVEGHQISSESLVQNGEILWTAYAERNYDRLEEFAPYVIEDGCDMPPYSFEAYFENDWEAKAQTQLQKACSLIGLENGVLKGDLVWDNREMWIIEVATRLSGGKMCSDITPEVWGVDFVGMAIRLALGDHIYSGEINPYLRKSACQRFEFPVSPRSHPERGRSVIGYGQDQEVAEGNAMRQLDVD